MHLRPGLVETAKAWSASRRGGEALWTKWVTCPSADCACASSASQAARVGEIADPGQRQFRPGRGLDGSRHPLLADVGEHGPHALADQCLRDGAADAVARAGYQRRLARGVEWLLNRLMSVESPSDCLKNLHFVSRETARV